MPEGDSIRSAAARLAPVLAGERVLRAQSRWPITVDEAVGCTVLALEALGKNLLLHLDDATTLRVHLGMNGRVRALPPDAEVALSPGRVALRLDTARGVALCADAPRVERFRTRERAEQPALALGPDVMADGFVPAEAAARAGAAEAVAVDVLRDQRVACGIGNVWACELLFLHRVDPFAPAAAVPAATWEAMYRDAHQRMRAQVARGGPRDTTGLPGGPSHWVYGRRRPCLRCGTRVEARTHGRDLPRTTWWCPRCQPPRAP